MAESNPTTENSKETNTVSITLKPLKACNMGCSGCLPAGSQILMADGTTKPIEDIRVGDVVWSYRIRDGRTEKIECGTVIKTYTHKANHLYTVRTNQYGTRKLRLTGEHPVFTERGWVETKDLQVGDKILRVWHSRTEAALKNTDWTETGKKISATRKARLASGEIHPSKITPEGRRKISEMKKRDNPMRRPEVVKKVQATRIERGHNKRWGNTQKQREASRNRMLTNNPMKDPERVRRVLAKGNRTRAERGRISEGQLKLAEIVKGLGFDVELEHSVGKRFIDVAIPSLSKGLEYDAWWGHFTEDGRRKDKERDEELREQGWELLHLGPNEVYYPEVIGKIQDFLGAHSNSRQFIRIRKIEREELDVQVYNFAVSPNENYVADGFLVHNCYEGEIFRQNGNVDHYDLDAIIDRMKTTRPGESSTLHGGEILLMPLPDLRILIEALKQQGRHINMQTNASLITDGHIELFKQFGVTVGVSLNGPDVLNQDRLAVPFSRDDLRHAESALAITDQMTARIHDNIFKMRAAEISVSIICVLSKTNAGDDEKLDRLLEWAVMLGEECGIWHFRFNCLHEDLDNFGVELTEAEAAHAYVRLAEATFEDSHRQWLPFREYVDNLLGLGRQPCWHNGCDVYATGAVYSVFGDGSEGNCLRTAKDGIAYSRASGADSGMRGQILAQVPMEEGGCAGCRLFRVCQGGCPAEAEDGDWRNKSRFCGMYIAVYEYIEKRLKGLIPNFTGVPDWSTNDERTMMNLVVNRQHELISLNPLRTEWSKSPSAYRQDAREQKGK